MPRDVMFNVRQSLQAYHVIDAVYWIMSAVMKKYVGGSHVTAFENECIVCDLVKYYDPFRAIHFFAYRTDSTDSLTI